MNDSCFYCGKEGHQIGRCPLLKPVVKKLKSEIERVRRTPSEPTMAQRWCDALGVKRVPDDYPSPLESFMAENVDGD